MSRDVTGDTLSQWAPVSVSGANWPFPVGSHLEMECASTLDECRIGKS